MPGHDGPGRQASGEIHHITGKNLDIGCANATAKNLNANIAGAKIGFRKIT